MNSIEALHRRAHHLIPAGAHTYSKADDQFPENAPKFIKSATGALCYGLDGNEFVDYGMGIFAVSLGHAYPAVVEKIAQQLRCGNTFSRPSTLEGELAERLCDVIPCAEMVKFAKNGSDVTSAAIRLSRAYTGRDYVVRCRQHPFHSFNDWFIGATSRPDGVPSDVRKLTLSFSYNDIDSFQELLHRYPGKIACVILEPATCEEPQTGFLESLRDACSRAGIVLIFDEIISGFRWHIGGAQQYYGVLPDLATFGKGMGNGFAISALVGDRDIMSRGDMNGDVFLLSCTYGAELVGLTAGLATIGEFQRHDVVRHYWDYGSRLQKSMNQVIEKYNLKQYVRVSGPSCRPSLFFREPGTEHFSFGLKTLFMQEMVRRGVLMERIAISFSHGDPEMATTIEAFDGALEKLREAINCGTYKKFISGPIAKPVFTH